MGHRADTTPGGHGWAELASIPSSVTAARHLVRSELTERGLPARLIEDALVVVSELMGNAILHARPISHGNQPGGIRLSWTVADDEIRIDVTDGGGTVRPHVESPRIDSPYGRGLAIVDAVAADWGVTTSAQRVTVYAVVAR